MTPDKIKKSVKVKAGNSLVWVKVVAIHNKGYDAIGIMLNESYKYKWGEFVRLKAKEYLKFNEVVRNSTKIPDTQFWQVI